MEKQEERLDRLPRL